MYFHSVSEYDLNTSNVNVNLMFLCINTISQYDLNTSNVNVNLYKNILKKEGM